MTKKKTARVTRATTTELDALHKGLAEAFAAELERCKREGVAPSAQILSQARQFCQDNGVNVPDRATDRFDRLKDAIPDMDELEKQSNVVPITRGA